MDERKTRSQFTFYASFYKAVSRIKKKTDRADAYEVLCQYALEGTEPDLEKLPDSVAVVFEMCKPNLVASRRRAESGRKGGAAKQVEASGKQTEANPKQTQANSKQNGEPVKQEKDKDKDKDKEQLLGERAPQAVEANRSKSEADELSRLPAVLQPVMGEWLEYKKQRREKYTPAGLTALISETLNNANRTGPAAVAQVIRTSMASGYKGIVFDRLRTAPNTAAAMTAQEPTDMARAAVARMMQEAQT